MSLQYQLEVDIYARQRKKTPQFEFRNFYGQLLRIFVIELPSVTEWGFQSPTLALAVIKSVKISDTAYDIPYYSQFGETEVVDLNTVKCVVGRVKDGDQWGIVDRSPVVDFT